MRWIVHNDRPTAFTMGPPAQCLVLPGGPPQVSASTRATFEVGTGALSGRRACRATARHLPARRSAAASATPPAGSRRRARRATARTDSRPAENGTIRTRCTCFSGRLRSPTIAAKRERSSAPTMTYSSCGRRRVSDAQLLL
jgi:hypothetical protein